jgi:hypothetical protein
MLHSSRSAQDDGYTLRDPELLARVGLINPSVSLARGSGSRRIYNFQDLVAIRVALKLRRAGIFGKAMVRILDVLRRAGFDSPANVTMDVTPDGDVVVKLGSGERVSARRRPGQLVLDFTCDCRKEVAELQRLLQPNQRHRPEAAKPDRIPPKKAEAMSVAARDRKERRRA